MGNTMELTPKQRAELAAIREDHVAEMYRRDGRRGDKIATRGFRERLTVLADAWDALDEDTQTHILVAVVRDWGDEACVAPSVSSIARVLSEETVMATGTPPHVPGLRQATMLLWTAWCDQRQWEQPVMISRDALASMGEKIVELFGLTDAEARRRVENILRDLDAKSELARREVTRKRSGF